MAPAVGFEPTTLRLTAGCSTVELCRNLRYGPWEKAWLGILDSNQDYLIQSQAGYRYPNPQWVRPAAPVWTGAAGRESILGSDLFSPLRSTFGPGGLNGRVRNGNG